MKEIRLLQLNLRNFKGVKQFTLDARGGNVKVFGDNATGKTTLFDGFVYLLFDKDSQNKKDFSIKTLNNGKEVHNLEHEVEATFIVNGQVLAFRKVYAEKWTKKRGSATSDFTGHTTIYYVDGVPVKKNEYQDKVDSIVNEDLFKLLTSPSYFNEQLKWQNRRKTLLELCGDISDEEVIALNSKLSHIPLILQGRTIENHRKIIASRRAEINKEIEKIPTRIDEINRSLPIIDDLNKEVIETEISQLNTNIDEKMTLISSIRNGKAISDKQMAIQQIDMDLINIKRDHESGSNEKIHSLKMRLQEEESNLSLLESKLNKIKDNKRYNDCNVQRIDDYLQQLRNEWKEVNSQVFIHPEACECPACGQALPEEQVEEAKNKALAQFNLKKAKEIEQIDSRAKENIERRQGFITANEALLKEDEKLNSQIIEKTAFIKKVKGQLKDVEANVIDITENPVYVTKLQDKQQLQAEITNIRSESETAIQDIQTEIITLKSNRDEQQRELGKFALADQSKARMDELSEQERTLAAEYEKLEQELYLTEEFIRTKVNLLEEKINSKFKYARFKLFDTQINGGLTEVCETLYEGVPYSSGLNNAARINVGLDIINTLSEHYGFSAPIFIDNSEAVTKLIDTNAQTISLIVSEPDKTLRVETQGNYYEEAM